MCEQFLYTHSMFAWLVCVRVLKFKISFDGMLRRLLLLLLPLLLLFSTFTTFSLATATNICASATNCF